MSMASSPVRTILRVALVPLCLCIATVSANAQADRCGTLAEVLKFGVDETDVASTQREARRLYQFACDEQSRVRQRNNSTSINASYALFSAGAKNNSSSIDDYRDKHCSLSENDVASFATDSFRQRSVNPEAVDAWSACIGNQTGILLDPRLDPNQKVASFSITYDARRFAAVPTLRGISSETFACQTAGKGDPIGVGGEPLAISPTEALVIRCDRDSDTSAIEGRPVTVYREDSMILDLSTGGHRIDFAERREGPVVEEFAQLQDRVRSLETRALQVEAAVDQITSGGSIFGDWITIAVDFTQMAQTDGILVAFSEGPDSIGLWIGEADGNLPQRASGRGAAAPVKKGQYYRVATNGGSPVTAWWMPIVR